LTVNFTLHGIFQRNIRRQGRISIRTSMKALSPICLSLFFCAAATAQSTSNLFDVARYGAVADGHARYCEFPDFLALRSRMRSPEGAPVGELRRVNITNFVVYNADPPVGSIISGIPGHILRT
jgi:hypothetical protein